MFLYDPFTGTDAKSVIAFSDTDLRPPAARMVSDFVSSNFVLILRPFSDEAPFQCRIRNSLRAAHALHFFR